MFVVASTPVFASGQEICESAGSNFSALCRLRLENTGGIVGTIVQLILVLGIIIALFFLVWGGVQWISSGGDKAKISAARSRIIAALIGLVIGFLAFAIVNFVLYFFTGQNISGMSVPRLID